MAVPYKSKAACSAGPGQAPAATRDDTISFKERKEEYTEGVTGVPSDRAQNHWKRCVPYTGIRSTQEKKK